MLFVACTLLLLWLADVFSTRSIQQDDYNKLWWTWSIHEQEI
jgi:hypothetical protein